MESKATANFYTRAIEEHIREINEFFPCVLITGPRQVGKSTLLRHMLPKGMRYITLDDYDYTEKAQNDPMGLLEEMGTPLCIDEVQYAPELLRAIKVKIDRDRRPGMYWLTSSQRFDLTKGVTESLAGRIGIAEMHTLSQQEVYGGDAFPHPFTPPSAREHANEKSLCDLPELYRRIWRGGYPELVKRPRLRPQLFFSSYIKTYIERDVNALSRIGNHTAFVKFMKSAALRTGQQLVYSDLAKDADVTPKTAAAWISILETSGIISLLEPYYVNTTKRLAKTPKLYFLDTGLCCHLAGYTDPKMLMNSHFAGAILETWVYGQLLRSFANCGISPRLTYYRERDRAEVDFLLEQDGCLFPMEVKRSHTPTTADLKAAADIPVGSLRLCPGTIFCTANRIVSLPHGAQGFPISML